MIPGYLRNRVREIEGELEQLLTMWKQEPQQKYREGINDAIIDLQQEYKSITKHFYYGQAKIMKYEGKI